MKTTTRLVLEFSGIVLVGLGAAIFAVSILNPPKALPAPAFHDPYLSRNDRSGDPLLHLPERVMLWGLQPLALPKPQRPRVAQRYRRPPPLPPRPEVEATIVRVTTVVPELPLYPER